MNARDLPIFEPCSIDFGRLVPGADGTSRHCHACGTFVFDLSRMTAAQAERMLSEKSTESRVCVRYLKDADGAIVFKHEAFVPASSLRKKLTRVLAVGVAAVAACATEACGGARPSDRSPNGIYPGIPDESGGNPCDGPEWKNLAQDHSASSAAACKQWADAHRGAGAPSERAAPPAPSADRSKPEVQK
jgi:hypothetical protein